MFKLFFRLIGFYLLSAHMLVAQEVSVSFEVNMSYQIRLGKFNPENEKLDVAGTFNGWG